MVTAFCAADNAAAWFGALQLKKRLKKIWLSGIINVRFLLYFCFNCQSN